MKNRFNNSNFLNSPQPDVAPGSLLVASLALSGTPFDRAVILVLQNNSEGTFGVVLNRPAGEKIKFAWQEMTGSDNGNRNIVQGGPIGGPVFALHQQRAIAEMAMPGGIFVTAQSDKFPQIVEQTESNYRIVFGIAGWRIGQLLQEIQEGLWYQLDGNSDQVFDHPEFMWEKSLRRYGKQVLCNVVGLDALPNDPLLN